MQEKIVVANGLNIKSWASILEEAALDQAFDLALHPKTFHHIALMPDTHCGYGMPIGGVIATKGVVIPNAVGVDIGCGMIAVKTNIWNNGIFEEDLLQDWIDNVHRRVPVGFNVHRKNKKWEVFQNAPDLKPVNEALPRARKSLGTLGGGNHFIELQEDENGHIWLMVHSGSRNLGKVICDYYNGKAKEYCESLGLNLKDLCYLDLKSQDGIDYCEAMDFALWFAQENRARIMNAALRGLSDVLQVDVEEYNRVNIHHNYAAVEVHFGEKVIVHRKGATAAFEGQLGIIPGSMGTSSYIVEGLGNPESFMSCSHGAGRRMGRNQATRTVDVEAAEKAMEGIAFKGYDTIKRGSLKGKKDLGESPLAYKDIDVVMENQKDLVKIVHKLRPLAVVKG